MERTTSSPAAMGRRPRRSVASVGAQALPPRPAAVALIVPGWRDSGPGHWQSLWADRIPGALRVQGVDWLHPRREEWVDAITRCVLQAEAPVVVVAHSLGCIATTHLPLAVAQRLQGALLVAPADPERRAVLHDFAPVPARRLPYRSIVVASGNDPFCPARLAGAYARSWGSEFLRLPAAGHINIESGHGEWPLGWALLQSLLQPDDCASLPMAV